jgi:hypothetical protein
LLFQATLQEKLSKKIKLWKKQHQLSPPIDSLYVGEGKQQTYYKPCGVSQIEYTNKETTKKTNTNIVIWFEIGISVTNF